LRRHDKAHRRDWEEIDVRLEDMRSPELSPRRRRRKPKKRRRRRRSSVRLLILLALALVSVLYGGYLLTNAVFSGDEEDTAVTVVVEKGDTLSSVADKLEEAGVIESSTLFKLGVRLEGEDTEIKPGEYRFSPGEDSDEILETLSSGDSISTIEVTIPEGLTLKQTAQVIEEETGIPAAEFEEAAKKTDYRYAFLDDPDIETIEGFLFPKRYEFEKDTDASQIVDRLLEQYLVETKDLDFEEAQDRLNLTEYELVTVASIIEKEAANDEERPLVASVIYNRIRANMPLQVDATIQYALDEPKEDLSLVDLKIESPYNTYKNPGLPPSPVASPGRESIRAALEPAKTDYLYYVLEANSEEHFFTNDYDEFLNAKQKSQAE
jgi:UPF0755 protein